MSDILQALKMAALQAILPTAIGAGKEILKDEMRKLNTKSPKKFGILAQGLYPPIKGLLVPFVHSTKSKIDDMPTDAFCEAIEEVCAEVGITLPAVVPIDFTTPDEPEVPEVPAEPATPTV